MYSLFEAKEVYKARKGSGSSTASSDTDSGVGGSSGDTSPVYAIAGYALYVQEVVIHFIS